MSQSEVRGGSSIRRLEKPVTYEQAKNERMSEGGGGPDVDIVFGERNVENLLERHGEDLESGKEERIEEAMDMMSSMEPEVIDIGIGEIQKISEEMLIERTEAGFKTYYVVD